MPTDSPGSRSSPPPSSSPRSPTYTHNSFSQPWIVTPRLALRMPTTSPGSRSSPLPSSSPRSPTYTHNSFSQPWIVTPNWLCACPQPVRGHDPHPRHPLRLAHLPTHNSFSQPWIVTPDWLCACLQPVRGHNPHPRHPLRLAHLPHTTALATLGLDRDPRLALRMPTTSPGSRSSPPPSSSPRSPAHTQQF